MNKLHFNPSKALIVTVAVSTGLVIGGLTVSRSEAALDWLGFEQKLQQHDEQLDNHEARIDNTEADVEVVQQATNTPAAQNRQNVPQVTTPNPAPAPSPTPQPTPPPVTVNAYEAIVVDENNTDCKWTYTDGTTNTFRWKSYSTNSQGQKVGTINNYCDGRAIGQIKGA